MGAYYIPHSENRLFTYYMRVIILFLQNITCIAYFRTNFYWVTVTLYPAEAYIHTLLVLLYIARPAPPVAIYIVLYNP